MKLLLPNPAFPNLLFLPLNRLVLLVRPASQESIRHPTRQSPVFVVVNWDTQLDSASRLTLPKSKPPSALYCKNCSLSYSYTDDTTITINLKTCLAHQSSQQKKPKHEAAAKVQQKIDNMMEKGIPLNEGLSVMGLSHEKFNKIKIRIVVFDFFCQSFTTYAPLSL